MRIALFILIFISSICAMTPKELIGEWEMSTLNGKKSKVSFGLYNSYHGPFSIEFKKNNIVIYHEQTSYYIFDTNKIFVSKHKPINGVFPNPKSIDVYEITGQVHRKDTNGRLCYEIHILQKAINGMYSTVSDQKICK